jgi:predicted dehydrogenase
LKVVIIGFGSIGQRHCKNLLEKSNTEIYLCTKHNLKNFKNSKRIQNLTSLDECLKNQPDIGLVCNTSNLHVETAIKLAKNNCHLLIEKPLSNSLKNMTQLLSLVEKNKIITLMGFNLRFHPCLIKIKQILSKNKIGRIIYIHAENGSYLPDWHPKEDYRKSYSSQKTLGGGAVLTCLHEIDYLSWLFGDVKEVSAISGKFSDLEIESEDLASTSLKFKNNIIAHVHLDLFQRPTQRTCKIVGTNGTLFCDFNRNIVSLYELNKKKWKEIMNLKNYNINDMYVEEIKQLLKCVRTQKKSVNDIDQGLKILKIGLAILKSSKTNKVVQLERHS